jgi:hypothetical protein
MKYILLYFAVGFCATMLLRECRRRAANAPIYVKRPRQGRILWSGCAAVDAVLFLALFFSAAVLTTVAIRERIADKLIAEPETRNPEPGTEGGI